MVDRLSTGLIFNLLGDQVQRNQKEIFDLSKVINSGKKFVSAHDDPIALIGSIQTEGRILDNDQGTKNRNIAITELEAGEVALRSMNDIMNRIYEIALRGGTASTSADERLIQKDEVRRLGESLIQLANSKSGNKFIFSGKQSNLQTLRLEDNAAFSNVVYKHGQDNSKERVIDELESSISLKDLLADTASTAKMNTTIVNPTVANAGTIDFEVNDGNDNVTSFSVSLAAADNLSNIISKINTAWTTAGGAGSIAQESPSGYLEMDTALITGNTANSKAKIQVKSSSTTALTNELHIKKQSNFGKEMGIMHTLASLETALSTNDDTTIKNLVENISYNLEQVNRKQSQIGLRISQAERFNGASEDLDIQLRTDLSTIQDVDFIDANVKLANAQVALETSIRTSASFFSSSILNFIT